MSYFGSGNQNGQSGRAGGTPQTTLLTGPPQLFVNSNQLQFQTGTQNFTFPQSDGQQGQLQLNTGGAPLLLQPPVNFVTDQLGVGLGQLITQAAVTQNQQSLQNIMNIGNVLQMEQSQSGSQQSKQRVFTGMVTKIHDNFGFIDEEVFFQMGVVKGPILPKEGDRVLVEADFNPSMPFKWNATRVQIVNMGGGPGGQQQQQQQQQQSGYQQQQMMGYPTSMASNQKPIQAPPPPSISGRTHAQTVSIVSNPHSIYSSSTGRPVHVPESMSVRRPPQLQSHMSSDPIMSQGSMGGLPPLLQKIDRGERREISPRDRDRDRKDREKDRERVRDRSKERLRERERERDRRDNSPRERRRSRSRSKSPKSPREGRRVIRRPSPSPPPKRRSRERERERIRYRTPESRVERALDRLPAERIVREQSPLTGRSSKGERTKRSRSRDTVKSDSKNPSNDKSRSISPGRRKPSSVIGKPPPRYSIQVPHFPFDTLELNGKMMRQRYGNLYIPSDFFLARATWMEAFPLEKPFKFGKPCYVHIFGRRVERIEIPDIEALSDRFKQVPNLLEAPDSSNTFKVKVMILSVGSIESIYKKTGVLSENKKENGDAKEEEGFSTLPRLLNFVVGVKTGKHDIMALGGSWSPTLDGVNPQSDPHVLINTAIRSVKALAGIDLTRCKQWYRFMELYYRRSNGNLETVVYFLPDLTSCVPSKAEWDSTTSAYRIALHGKDKEKEPQKKVLSKGQGQTPGGPPLKSKELAQVKKPEPEILPAVIPAEEEEEVQLVTEVTKDLTTEVSMATVDDGQQPPDGEVTKGDGANVMEVVDECNGDEVGSLLEEEVAMLLHEITEDGGGEPLNKADNSFDIYDDIVEVTPQENQNVLKVVPSESQGANQESTESQSQGDGMEIVEGGEESKETDGPKGTHYSQIVVKNLNVAKLREELSLRNLNTKGLKAELITRLVEAMKEEQEADEAGKTNKPQVNELEKSSENTQPQTEESKAEEEGEGENEGAGIRFVDPSKILETSISEEGPEGEVIDISQEQEDQEEEDTKIMEEGEINEECESPVKVEEISKSIYPIIKPEMSNEEKKLWERRYTLPKGPKVLMFPAKSVKSGAFDCSLMPLSSLRDYRLIDSREESFEVSLFSEFFYEMLQRDFAFRIYQEIERQARKVVNKGDKGAEPSKDSKDEGVKEKERKEVGEPTSKRRKTSTASNVTGDSKEKEGSPKEKLILVDPFLLLAFNFFDQYRCGYILDVDVEEICGALGLRITRRELRKVLKKVLSNSCLRYKKWTHKSESEVNAEPENSEEDPQWIKKLSIGNKSLLPVFTYSTPVVTLDESLLPNGIENNKEKVESILVTVDGQLVDVRKIKNQVETAEQDRIAAEANANVLKNSLNEAKNQVTELKKSQESLKDELSRTKEILKKLEASEKSNKDDLEVFKKATERFMERVKDVAKLPTCTKEKKSKDSKDEVKEKTVMKSTISVISST